MQGRGSFFKLERNLGFWGQWAGEGVFGHFRTCLSEAIIVIANAILRGLLLENKPLTT